jgi:hypothetical protein
VSFLQERATDGGGIPQFGNPVHCVKIAKDGLVYICDRSNDRIQIFRKDGTFVSEFIIEKNTLGPGLGVGPGFLD